MILPSYEGGFSGAITIDGNICIGDTLLRKYMPKYMEPMSNRNKVICRCKTWISAILLQSDLNKCRISRLSKFDKLYINSASTRLLERSKNNFIEKKKQISPNDSHKHLRACDAASSYRFPSPITGSKIPKWDCILNCYSDFPMMNAQFLESSEQLNRYFLHPFIKLSSIYFKTYPNIWYGD